MLFQKIKKTFFFPYFNHEPTGVCAYMNATLLHNRAVSAKKCSKKRAKLLFCQPKGLFTWMWGTPVR